MELIADLVRRRIPCCSQAACCSAGARFEHCRATSTTGRHPITDVGILFAWARSCGACDTVSLMYPPWPCRHPPAPRPGPPDPPAPPHRQGLGLLLGNFACNSPTALSKNELTTLELQRFQALLNLRPIELHATFAGVPPLPPLTSIAARPLKLLRRSPHR